jgi:pimeloyl-ACP methyl ester carboxylesterase
MELEHIAQQRRSESMGPTLSLQRRAIFTTLVAAGATLAVPKIMLAHADAGTATPATEAEGTSQLAAESGFAPVNGLQMYYEIHGDAVDGQPPLLLLHGGFLSIATSFAPIIPEFASQRQVVAVEQQGHGHTADIDRPLTFEQEADDTAAALEYLGIDQVDVYGYSDGGNVALGLAIRHPELVRKVAIAGTNITNEDLVPGLYDFMEGMTPEMLGDELKSMYEAEAPNPEDWPVLVEKIKEQVIALEGWTPEQLASISAPTLFIVGDEDIITPERAVERYRQIPSANLAVLPMRDHLELGTQPEWILLMLEEFFAAPMPEASPATPTA